MFWCLDVLDVACGHHVTSRIEYVRYQNVTHLDRGLDSDTSDLVHGLEHHVFRYWRR